MNNKIIIRAILIALIGVFGVDYFSHLYFSAPMETQGYFFGKAALFFVFSLFFLKKEFIFKRFNAKFKNILFGGIIVSSIWGIYYYFKSYNNLLPGISISIGGLSFLGMGILGTVVAFGIVHALAFVVGFYTSEIIGRMVK